VLWTRMLDRRRGAHPPAMLAVDPRDTPVAREADVHLAPRAGTNLALMNGLLREVIHRGAVDKDYVAAHTLGFEELCQKVEAYPFSRVAEICDVPVADLERAADLLCGAHRLLSTVLQGFYQSNQATAASCQVNNLHLLRGMLGRPGAGLYQMNGQPTAQNTRETGADGDLPGFRNWANQAHIEELARLWNVEPDMIPHWAPPTHAMQIFRYAEQGSIKLLWISATNPAVSLPDLARIRRILADPACSSSRRTSSPPRPPSLPTWCCRPPPGARSSARSPTWTAPCTCPSPRSSHLARPARTWTSSSTTRGAWTSATATASR